MGIRTRKLLLCIDTMRVGTEAVPTRRVRVLDDVTMLPLVETTWDATNEKAAVVGAINQLYASGGTSRNPHRTDAGMPMDPEAILDHIANLDENAIRVISSRLNRWGLDVDVPR